MDNFINRFLICLPLLSAFGSTTVFADKDEHHDHQDRHSDRHDNPDRRSQPSPQENRVQTAPRQDDRRQFNQPGSSIQKRQEFEQRMRNERQRSETTKEFRQLPPQDMDAFRNRISQSRQNRIPPERSPDFMKKANDFKNSYTKRSIDDKRESRTISDDVRNRFSDYGNWFTPNFYNNRHHYHGRYWRNGVDWWRGAPWNRVHTWLGWGSGASILYPIYYYNGYPIQYDSGWNDAYNDPSYPQFIEGDWLPLGVFTLAPSIQGAANSTMFIQLAVDRNGEISGTFYNSSTDISFPLVGFIDKQTQEAFWEISGENTFAPEMATGIFNLTQDVADVEMTFPTGVVQNWILVKVGR